VALRVCVDASLAVKLVVRESLSDRALDLWQDWIAGGVELVVPPVFPFEVSSVIRNKHVRNDLTNGEAQKAFNLFVRISFVVLTPEGLLEEAWDMARALRLPTLYDASYLALATLCDCEFWTADEALVNSLRGKLSWVKWIGG